MLPLYKPNSPGMNTVIPITVPGPFGQTRNGITIGEIGNDSLMQACGWDRCQNNSYTFERGIAVLNVLKQISNEIGAHAIRSRDRVPVLVGELVRLDKLNSSYEKQYQTFTSLALVRSQTLAKNKATQLSFQAQLYTQQAEIAKLKAEIDVRIIKEKEMIRVIVDEKRKEIALCQALQRKVDSTIESETKSLENDDREKLIEEAVSLITRLKEENLRFQEQKNQDIEVMKKQHRITVSQHEKTKTLMTSSIARLTSMLSSSLVSSEDESWNGINSL